MKKRFFRNKLSLPHLAYLRALAQGLAGEPSARRYLGLKHGHEYKSLHDWVIDLARAVAKRAGCSAWRLLGVEITPVLVADTRPSLSQWAESNGWEDFSEAEILERYEDEFASLPIDKSVARKAARADRLLKRRMDLIRRLEETAAATASPGDPISAWFDGPLVDHLTASGIVTLGSLLEKIRIGGQWWVNIEAIGPVKALRLAAAVTSLFPPTVLSMVHYRPALAEFAFGNNRAPECPGGLLATTDQEAIDEWLSTHSRGGATTVLAYRREARRFALFCANERRVAISGAKVSDCQAYIDFLDNIPEKWISRKRAKPFDPGWAPFRGQLSAPAKKLSLTAVKAMYVWLVKTRYLLFDPWVGTKPGKYRDPIVFPKMRSIPRAAWKIIESYLDQRLEVASNDMAARRMQFLLRFALATGLRPSELVNAKLREFTAESEMGAILSVVGKGDKPRLVPVPRSAIKVLNMYLSHRGLRLGDKDGEDAPLIASTKDALAGISYRVLLRSFQSLVRNAISESDQPPGVRDRLMGSTLHWLRHTHATRFVEAGGAIAILQANLGHTDPKTTALYYPGELEDRVDAMETAFPDD